MTSSPHLPIDFHTVLPNFFAEATELKSHFDSHFAKPLETKEDNFRWNYWYVEDQYKLLRTPAESFFPEALFNKFVEDLTLWGQKNLGCTDISPIWLSYYIDGCEQKMHTDSGHGPFAFVYSLTDWENRSFSGGETFFLKPETLSYWDYFSTDRGFEQGHFIEKIPSHFNQLTVFDPRLPHGVEKVIGESHPQRARIALHGWFIAPGLCDFSPSPDEKLHLALDEKLQSLYPQLAELGSFDGILTLKLSLEKGDSELTVETLVNNLVILDSDLDDEQLIEIVTKELKTIDWSQLEKPLQISLPFLFKS